MIGNPLCKKFIEIKIMIDQKFNWLLLKHHFIIGNFTFWPDIKAKRSVSIFDFLFIPFKCANANLKRNEFLDDCFHLFVALFSSVVLMTLFLYAGIVSWKFCVYCYEVCFFNAFLDEGKGFAEVILSYFHILVVESNCSWR